MIGRRFPPPWVVVQIAGGYRVEDADGNMLGYFYGYSERELGTSPGKLTFDEARRMAVNFAKLPELLQRKETPDD